MTPDDVWALCLRLRRRVKRASAYIPQMLLLTQMTMTVNVQLEAIAKCHTETPDNAAESSWRYVELAQVSLSL